MAGTAEALYENFINHLRNKDKLEGLLQNFRNTKHLETLFEQIWSLPDSQELLKLPRGNPEINRKGKVESEKFRSEGNRLYKEKKFEKALIAYNYSVLTAPHPDLKDSNSTEPACDMLSLAFSNRSALLFEMGEYTSAISDIERALQYGYPPSKSHKLVERKGKCFLALQEIQKAEKLFTDLSQVEDSKDYSKKNLEDLIKRCKCFEVNKSNKPTKDNESPPKNGRYRSLFYTGPQSAPQPLSKVQVKEKDGVVQLSDLVEIRYSPERGRHLVATKDLEPGVVLISEVAQCSSVYLDCNLRLYCTTCHRRTPIVIPCPMCSLVVFCSESCRKIALEEQKFHSIECSILPIFVALKPDPSVVLAFKSISTKSFEELKTEVKEIKEKYDPREKKTDKSDSIKDQSFLKVDYNFESLYNLEGNISARKDLELLESAVYSVLLVNLLWKLPSFSEKHEEGTPVPSESAKFVGAHLIALILKLQCNIHLLKELHIDINKSINSLQLSDLGCGVFCALSLTNHECAPNTLNSTVGNVKYSYSISTIAKGEEITDSYGERFVSHNLESRRKNLQESYYFKCTCKACKENWPMFKDLPMKFSIKCPNCEEGVNLGSPFCNHCRTLPNNSQSQQQSKNKKKKNKKQKSIQDIEQLLADAWQSYQESYEEINNYKTSTEAIKKISKFISLLDKHSILPNQQYIYAQETLMRCFDLMGSQRFLT